MTLDPFPLRQVERYSSPLNADVALAAAGEFSALRLGALEVWPPVVLAPMAGVTNYAYRSLCREQGAGLYVSEMITARGYLLGNRLTHKLAAFGPEESPRSLQLYGSHPRDIGEAVARLVGEEQIDHLDLNFGCPVRKVTRSGGGSAIPVRPKLLARLVRAAVLNAGRVPVTIKVRMGIDEELLTYRDSGAVAEGEGASAIGLHARTAAQLYSGAADWEAIADLVGRVRIPVLGNGDIWEAFDALRMMRSTGCAGVIVGRGCLGRPWLFRELAQVFDGCEPAPPPCLAQVIEIMLEHARRLLAFFGPQVGMRQMRKWCAWYTKGFHGSSKLRPRLMQIESLEQLASILNEMDGSEPFPPAALRAQRAKGSKCQRVSLPEGYLDQRDSAEPPCDGFGELDFAADDPGAELSGG